MQISLENARGYKTEQSLMRGLRRFNFVSEEHGDRAFFDGHELRYIICRKPNGDWTAVFLLSECLRVNKIGGYVGVYAERSFTTI